MINTLYCDIILFLIIIFLTYILEFKLKPKVLKIKN